LEIFPVQIKKEITSKDNLSELILAFSTHDIQDGDILVVSQKIISKNEGKIVDLSSVTPSILAIGLSGEYNKDPRLLEVILSESKKIIRMYDGILIVETYHGFVCANAGVDESNVSDGYVTLLPKNSDTSGTTLREQILKKTGKSVAVLISDTFGRPFRMGQTDCALGISGMSSVVDYRNKKDSFGKLLRVSVIAIADELCSAAELVMNKTDYCPVAIIRNYYFNKSKSSINELIRPESKDLFR